MIFTWLGSVTDHIYYWLTCGYPHYDHEIVFLRCALCAVTLAWMLTWVRKNKVDKKGKE